MRRASPTTEIKIGQTMPYSGPASAYGVIGRTETRLFQDDQRAGRRQRPQDQSHQPRRRLQPAEDGRAGAPPGRGGKGRFPVQHARHARPISAIRQYLNDNKVPQLFVATGAAKWADPEHFPWTMGFNPNYQTEARIYAKQSWQTKPNAKIAVLYQNDDFGKDYLKGFKDGLGATTPG